MLPQYSPPSSDLEKNSPHHEGLNDETTPMVNQLKKLSSVNILPDDSAENVQTFDVIEPKHTLSPHLKLLLLILQFSFITWTPIISQFALYNYATQRKESLFLPQSPYAAEFFISILIANLVSCIAYGSKGLSYCWDLQGIKTFLPVSLFHGTSVSLQLISMVSLDGVSRSVLDQFKLPFIVLLGFVFFKRTLSLPRFFSLSILVLAGLGFILNKASIEQPIFSQSAEYFTLGLPLGLTTSILSVVASLLLDVQMKHQPQTPYITQIAQLRTSSFIVVTIGLLIQAYIRNQLNHLFFQGWNSRVVMLVFWLVAKDYSTIFLLKRLTALHLAICTSAALCSTYILDIVIFQQYFPGIQSLLLICIMAFSIATYGSISHAEKKTLKKPALLLLIDFIRKLFLFIAKHPLLMLCTMDYVTSAFCHIMSSLKPHSTASPMSLSDRC